MEILNVIFGVITILAFIFAIYQHLETKSKSKIEEFKANNLLEKIRLAKYSAVTTIETTNIIVQRSKEKDVTNHELRNLARVTRGNLLILIEELKVEEEKLSNWKYGQFKSIERPNENMPIKISESDE